MSWEARMEAQRLAHEKAQSTKQQEVAEAEAREKQRREQQESERNAKDERVIASPGYKAIYDLVNSEEFAAAIQSLIEAYTPKLPTEVPEEPSRGFWRRPPRTRSSIQAESASVHKEHYFGDGTFNQTIVVHIPLERQSIVDPSGMGFHMTFRCDSANAQFRMFERDNSSIDDTKYSSRPGDYEYFVTESAEEFMDYLASGIASKTLGYTF